MPQSFSFINRDRPSAECCRKILGLPEGLEWSELTVEFGLESFGEVRLTILPTGEQVRDLAELAIQRIQDSCVAPEPYDGIECPNCTVYDREDCLHPEGH